MKHRYITFKKTIQLHCLVSFGISIISKMESNDSQNQQKYVCDNFNFVVLKDGEFMMNTDAGIFLCKNNFSFDELFKEGIPFRSQSDNSTNHKTTSKRLSGLWKQMLSIMREEQIPLIVHNGLLDLMYIYDSFILALPDKLERFVVDLAKVFSGGIYDTKYISEKVVKEDVTFLSYLFARYGRLVQERFDTSTQKTPYFYIEANQPILETRKRKSDDESVHQSTNNKKQKNNLHYCEDYANKGYCGRISCSHLSHDVEVILDHLMGPRKYPIEQAAEETIQVVAEEVKRSNNNAHLAYFDAYMTAYVFCYLVHSMDEDQLKMEKNKLNLMNFTQPLIIKK
ncbi:hypothetical protein K501DRAFT_208701, partial [Backusella circina FSU 941]